MSTITDLPSTINVEEMVNKNFIVSTYELSTKLEEETQRYVKGARDKGKGIEEVWQGKHKSKSQKQIELAQHSKYMAFISTFLLVASVASSVGGTAITITGNQATGKLLTDIGSMVSNQGTSLAGHLSASYTTPIQSEIEKMTTEAQKVWEADKRANETREEALKSLQEKASSATQSATERLGQAFSQRG